MKLSKRRILLLAALGLGAYLLTLIATAPAAVLWQVAGGQLPVQAYGLSGTLWSGRAAAVQQQQLRLDDVRWELSPLPLLLGRLSGELRARPGPEGTLSGSFSAGSDSYSGDELRLEVAMPQLMRWVRLPMLPPEAATGRFEAFLDSVEVDNNQLVGAEGILNWHQARIELGQGLDLGELALRLQNTEQGIQGTLQNQESPLEIGGDLSLDREGNFDLTLRVTPTDQASQQALAMLGMGGRSGTQTVRVRGQLTPDGLKLQQLNQG